MCPYLAITTYVMSHFRVNHPRNTTPGRICSHPPINFSDTVGTTSQNILHVTHHVLGHTVRISMSCDHPGTIPSEVHRNRTTATMRAHGSVYAFGDGISTVATKWHVQSQRFSRNRKRVGSHILIALINLLILIKSHLLHASTLRVVA